VINQAPADRFTLAHLVLGFVAGELGASPLQAVAVAVGWELVETPLKRAAPAVFPHASADTLANATVDALAFMAGYLLSR
jgi:hypothetical protein